MFTPNADFSGTSTFTFQVMDNGLTANTGVDLDGTARLATIVVNSVNDAPSGTTQTINTNQNVARTLTAADFGFSDMHDTPQNHFIGIKIGAVTGGTLTFNGAAVPAVVPVTGGDTPAINGTLVFTPNSRTTGTIAFQVQDDGGTTPGVDTDPTAKTLSIAINFVSQTPLGTAKTITIPEDKTYTFGFTGNGVGPNSDFGFSDANDVPPDNFASVKFSALNLQGGTLLDGTTPISNGSEIPVAEFLAGNVTFTPAADSNGSPAAELQLPGPRQRQPGQWRRQPRSDAAAVHDQRGLGQRRAARHVQLGYHQPGQHERGQLGRAQRGQLRVQRSARPSGRFVPGREGLAPVNGTLFNGATQITSFPATILKSDLDAGSISFKPAADFWGSATLGFQVQDNGGTTVITGSGSTNAVALSSPGVDTDPVVKTLTITVASVADVPQGFAARPRRSRSAKTSCIRSRWPTSASAIRTTIRPSRRPPRVRRTRLCGSASPRRRPPARC